MYDYDFENNYKKCLNDLFFLAKKISFNTCEDNFNLDDIIVKSRKNVFTYYSNLENDKKNKYILWWEYFQRQSFLTSQLPNQSYKEREKYLCFFEKELNELNSVCTLKSSFPHRFR